MTSCKKNQNLQWSLFLILWSMQAVFFIQKKIRKNAEKMGFKKIDSFFSGRLCTEQEGTWTQDFPPDHSSCLAGSRVVRHIRKRFAECLWAIRCNSGHFLRSQLAAQSFQILGNEKNNFRFQKIWHILYETSYMVQRNLLSWRVSVINRPLCMCALVLRFVGVQG